MRMPGVRDDDIEPPEFLHGAVDHRLDLGFIGHVYLDCDRLAIRARRDLRGSRLGGFLVQVRDDDMRAFLREPRRDRLPQSLPAAGDKRNPILQQPCSSDSILQHDSQKLVFRFDRPRAPIFQFGIDTRQFVFQIGQRGERHLLDVRKDDDFARETRCLSPPANHRARR